MKVQYVEWEEMQWITSELHKRRKYIFFAFSVMCLCLFFKPEGVKISSEPVHRHCGPWHPDSSQFSVCFPLMLMDFSHGEIIPVMSHHICWCLKMIMQWHAMWFRHLITEVIAIPLCSNLLRQDHQFGLIVLLMLVVDLVKYIPTIFQETSQRKLILRKI